MDRDAATLFEKMMQGDRVSLGQAMTIVESERFEDRENAIQLLEKCEKHLAGKDKSIRFAISGAPGAGKSTFIEAIGLKAISKGYKVGVITVDPTSTISHGSILGDKSRMNRLSVTPSAFIRSSAAGSVLGGMGRRSFELMTLLAAAGYDIIFLETVGVGQSEHHAWQITDGFILVLQPGGGDELQGIKRGITELADIVLVNKADGNFVDMARTARSHYQNALHYFSSLRAGWVPKILTCSALDGVGIDEAWDTLCLYLDVRTNNPAIAEERKLRKSFWLSWSLGHTAHQLLMNHPFVIEKLRESIVALHEKNTSLFRTEFEIENLMKALIDASTLNKTN